MIDCDGVFVAVGNVPNTKLVQNQVALNAGGYIVADESTRTNVPGVLQPATCAKSRCARL